MEVPLHKLNSVQTKLWTCGGLIRKDLANNLHKRYPGGVGVCSRTLYLIGYVLPNATIRDLVPPFKQYELHEMANRPGGPTGVSIKECQCANFYDPESNGPWGKRGDKLNNQHHPLCQFEPVGMRLYKYLVDMGHPPPRIDGWNKLREEMKD